jgi:protein-S-isoprenylcysteine O-methyltransferase Ste14
LPEAPSLGERGGGWVALQALLMLAVLGLGFAGPGWSGPARWWLKGAAALLVLAGMLVVVSASRALGSGLTPFPRPPQSGRLVESGPYTVVRHPIYSGGILFFVGISLALSWWALVGTTFLAAFWALKASVEERLLAERYPAYADYRKRTRYRLIPYVY